MEDHGSGSKRRNDEDVVSEREIRKTKRDRNAQIEDAGENLPI